MLRRVHSSGVVSFGSACLLVAFIVAVGAAMSLFNVNFIVAVIICAAASFLIVPLARFIP